MHDTVIRGGTIVDGTGKQAFTGDVAIDGDRITEVGGKAGAAKRDIAADGKLVTPGWVDVHTHYDGQATWDKELAPSSWHGVTTILFGNCGVGFAPVRRDHHASLIGLMEAVEEIPGITLSEGLKWDWETFPQYLDALERMPRAIDVAAQVPHHPLRVYVMGERAINREKATAEDIEAMRAHDARGAGGGRVRLHHLAHQLAQDADRRDGAWPLLRGAGASRHRLGAEGPEARRVRREQRLRHRERGARLDDAARPADRPSDVVPADRPPDRSRALAAADAGCAHRPCAGRHRHRTGGGPAGRRHAGRGYRAQSVLDPARATRNC